MEQIEKTAFLATYSIRDIVNEINKDISLTADDLIEKAEKATKTRGEYIAFMKGAAFLFYRFAKRNDGKRYGTPATIKTIEEAIEHCIKLLPFMEKDEKKEHCLLIKWLNELLVLQGKDAIPLPGEYFTDTEITEAWEEIKNYSRRKEHDIFEQTKRI